MSDTHGSHNDGLHLIKCQCNRNPLYLQSLRSPCSDGCGCGSTTGYCKAKSIVGPGAMSAVIDDANELTYFYGNIVHENYHVPEEECTPYFTVPTTSDTYVNKALVWAHESYEGVYSGDNITLGKKPSSDWPVLVFRNGIKQREGQDYEYTLTDKVLHFNFDPLLATDWVEVYYRYKPEDQ